MSDLPHEPVEAVAAVDEPTFDEFYENAGCGYLSLSPDGVIVRVNETFLAWTGRTREQVMADTRFADLLTIGGRLYFETHCAPMLAAGLELKEVALDVRRADGSVLLALLGATVHQGDDDKPTMVRLTVFDASQRRGFERHLVAERDFERQGRRYAEALSRISDRLALLETAEQISSAIAGELVGGEYATRVELVPRSAATLPSTASFTPSASGATVGVIPIPGSSGEAVGTLRVECETRTDDAERAFFVSAAELTGRALGRAQRVAAVARASRTAGASGLPNERWWANALKAEMRRAQIEAAPLTVVVVEISLLDQVTLSQGLGAADALMLAISDAWREAGFDLLSRFGGEEFAVLMPGLTPGHAKMAVARARRAAGTRRHFAVGIAAWNRQESALSLMSRAEADLPTDRPAT